MKAKFERNKAFLAVTYDSTQIILYPKGAVAILDINHRNILTFSNESYSY